MTPLPFTITKLGSCTKLYIFMFLLYIFMFLCLTNKNMFLTNSLFEAKFPPGPKFKTVHKIPSPYQGLRPAPVAGGLTCQLQVANVPGRIPQRQQARHLERTSASCSGRFLVTLYITIYAVRIIITLFKTC